MAATCLRAEADQFPRLRIEYRYPMECPKGFGNAVVIKWAESVENEKNNLEASDGA